ncbi:MAG: flavodoxin-dependent (E)-4-hydroxy-3-methylbut-2-enyl-diphosphate synthase, partial [Deltaproteobacteria bacterium]|nr:flavodoxin-dependent (E)-4-hydroxy-3-methylbut-2-enyl-diphosphate synthase [Deltaproteobacteria bacterium]
ALGPLVEALKAHGRSLRIGVNHGSLADRIMNRHGDTPAGMVESAMEYLRLLEDLDFRDTVVSMKSSNPVVAIQAYRLLVEAMDAEGMDYPLHLGVTEAGNREQGRIKSAIGIGALLMDGLGDTIRVSLTEAAHHEIPVARELLAAVEVLREGPAWPGEFLPAGDLPTGPSLPGRRQTREAPLLPLSPSDREAEMAVGGDNPVRFLGLCDGPSPAHASPGHASPAHASPGHSQPEGFDALIARPGAPPPTAGPRFVTTDELEGPEPGLTLEADGGSNPRLLLLDCPQPLFPLRRLAGLLKDRGLPWPLGVVLPLDDGGRPSLASAAQIGSLAADGLLDALVCPDPDPSGPAAQFCRTLLQGARLRIYQAEFISCPSCGRTLFDLERTTEDIKARTGHLKGVRIGVMGCIVNGPGEMADADFGYVGGAPGMVSLYKGRQCVARGIPSGQAVERLVALIKEHGMWTEP